MGRCPENKRLLLGSQFIYIKSSLGSICAWRLLLIALVLCLPGDIETLRRTSKHASYDSLSLKAR